MKRLRLFGLFLGLLLAAWSLPAQSPGEVRVALVIGNAAYAGAAALRNPVNDARAVGAALERLGFAVLEVGDASKEQMTQAIALVRERLRGKQGVGLLFYAGHGVQLDWRNYMVPVDARLTRAADLPHQAVDVALVLDAFRDAGVRMGIVVLDACRDNPFPGTTGAAGLAPVDAPVGTFLAYATAPGNVAADGDAQSGHGLYTRYLLDELGKPGARIEDVFKRVRLAVRQHSEGRQVPWESTSLEEDFVFNAGERFTRPDLRARELLFARELTDWERIRDSRRPADFYDYLQRYPNGFISEQAQFALDRLQAQQIRPQPNAQGLVVLASGGARYAVGDTSRYRTRDALTGQLREHQERITRIEDGRVFVNDGFTVFDQMGAILKNPAGVHEPGMLYSPADLALGKRWSGAYRTRRPNGSVATSVWDSRVVGLDQLELPAGRFKAYRIEAQGQVRETDGAGVTVRERYWIDPATMLVVRLDKSVHDGARTIMQLSTELVSTRRAR